jgi:hypothetical protein
MPVMGQFQEEDGSAILAPASIPLDIDGDAPAQVAMFRLDVSTKNDDVNWRELVSMDVTLTGTIGTNQVTAVRIYWEAQAGGGTPNDGIFDGTDSGGVLLGSSDFSGGSTVTITLLDNYVRNRTAGFGNAMFYVVYEFAAGGTADALDGTETVGATVSDIVHRPDGGGTTATYNDPTPPTPVDSDIDDYELTLLGDTTGLLFPDPTPGSLVTALRLQFGASDTSLSTNEWPLVSSITIDEIDTAVATDIDELVLFTDMNANNIYDGDDVDHLHGTATVSGSSVTISVLAVDQLAVQPFTYAMNIADGDEYLVAVQLSAVAQDGNVVRLQVPDAVSASISFYDSIDDSGAVDPTREYGQLGFVDPANGAYESPTPTSPAGFTIEPGVDLTEPNIIASIPDNGVTDVSRTLSQIRLTFDDLMYDDGAGIDTASVTTLSNYTATGPTTLSFTDASFIFATKTVTLTVDPASLPLQYEGAYTVTAANVENTSGLAIQTGVNDSISFTIESETFPTVLGTVPANESTGVAPGTTVSMIFSEPMEASTVIDPANFSLVETGDTTEIAGTMSYNPDANTATFTPDNSLGFNTSYTATVTTGVTDAEGSALEADYVFSFTTSAQIGDFTDAIVANNRIQPGSTDPMRIFVEVPAGSAETDEVAIQVFTATGRRVATLTVAGETYADVIARQPILWNGENGRGQPLGPGLYFVQVRSAGFEKAMRVLIVR